MSGHSMSFCFFVFLLFENSAGRAFSLLVFGAKAGFEERGHVDGGPTLLSDAAGLGDDSAGLGDGDDDSVHVHSVITPSLRDPRGCLHLEGGHRAFFGDCG